MSDSTNEREQIVPSTGADGPEDKKVGLPRPPFYASEYLDMAEILQFAMERFGQLILAIMRYTVDETVSEDLSPDLKIMFSIYQKKIDFAREKYKRKCETNAENGSKGGKAKAENAKKKATGPKFTPPTQKQFRDAVEHFIDDGEISGEATDYDADSFFDELRDAGWTIGGAPIQSRSDWESAIRERFFGGVRDSALPAHLRYRLFSLAFAHYHDGEKSSDAICDFMDAYDKASKRWVVKGESFPSPDWKNALARFMGGYSDSSDT